MACEFEVSGHAYRAGRLNPFVQSHIIRRLAPLVSAFSGLAQAIKDDPLSALEPMVQAFASMSDADVEYIQRNALNVVQRQQQGSSWAPVVTKAGDIMFDDIGALEMNRIVFEVLKDSLTPFFQGLDLSGFLPVAMSPRG